MDQISSIQKRVVSIVSQHCGIPKENICPESSFIHDLGCDSLDIVSLVMELDVEFGLNLTDEQTDKMRTVGRAIILIEALCAHKEKLSVEQPAGG